MTNQCCVTLLLTATYLSWAGVLNFHEHPVVLAESTLWGWEKWHTSWEQADVLILDEISMVDCDLLEEVGCCNCYSTQQHMLAFV